MHVRSFGEGPPLVTFHGFTSTGEQFASLAELGVDDVVARTIAVDQQTALRSIELLGDVRRTIA